MDVKLINHAFLHGLAVEVWHDGERIGSGRIVEHTKGFIRLDDGDYYFKAGCEVRVK
ncbi:hypothetical protein [Cohnella sp.]|uniref:hypothetical protein n=1 Tax=Cohnella sp. TaxID=1883426 RepID=UPI003703E480